MEFESWLERDRLILLDCDPQVLWLLSQPFWLTFTTAEGQRRAHAPDYLARLADGSGFVVDCRPDRRAGPRDRASFEVTAAACSAVDWRYEVVGAAEPVLMGNVGWLAGYRHLRHHLPAVAAGLREAFAEPTELVEGAWAVRDPVAVLPVLYHLLWQRELRVGLSAPLHTGSVVGR